MVEIENKLLNSSDLTVLYSLSPGGACQFPVVQSGLCVEIPTDSRWQFFAESHRNRETLPADRVLHQTALSAHPRHDRIHTTAVGCSATCTVARELARLVDELIHINRAFENEFGNIPKCGIIQSKRAKSMMVLEQVKNFLRRFCGRYPWKSRSVTSGTVSPVYPFVIPAVAFLAPMCNRAGARVSRWVGAL